MELKPGYKQTEVGVIPEDWDVKAVDELAKVTSGKRMPLGSSLTDRPNAHPYIRISDMVPGSVRTSDLMYVPESIFPAIKRFRIYSQDIFISVAGSLGIVGKIPNELSGANLTENADRITDITCSQDYLLYFLMSPQVQGAIDAIRTVGAQPKLALSRIRKFKIALPQSRDEQNQIANCLREVDYLLAELDQLITKKRLIKHAAMQELLTGKRRLPGFEGEWEVKRLGDIATIDPENLGSNTHPHYRFNYISLEDVDQGSLLDWSEQEFSTSPSRARRRLRRNDVLVSTVRPNLMSHLLFSQDGGEWVCSTGFALLRCNGELADPSYVFFHLFSAFINKQIEGLLTGSNYPAISSRDVRSLEIPVPALSEQKEIARTLTSMEDEIISLTQRLEKARLLKQGMMQQLLTGKIRLK